MSGAEIWILATKIWVAVKGAWTVIKELLQPRKWWWRAQDFYDWYTSYKKGKLWLVKQKAKRMLERKFTTTKDEFSYFKTEKTNYTFFGIAIILIILLIILILK